MLNTETKVFSEYLHICAFYRELEGDLALKATVEARENL